MYFLENWQKILFALVLILGYGFGSSYYLQERSSETTVESLKQLGPKGGHIAHELAQKSFIEQNAYSVGWLVVVVLVFLIFIGDLRRMLKDNLVAKSGPVGFMFLLLALSFSSVGCRKPYEPQKYIEIETNHQAFMIPKTADQENQTSSQKEEMYKKGMISSPTVKIPQVWRQTGYNHLDGEWADDAKLILVDTTPVTREWTADANSGTSSKNEAIWGMTSDQVEFSTGWTVTARIASREDCVKFLSNYSNGTLSHILDTEVRGKLQGAFASEVTDLPMEEMRKAATPHFKKIIAEVTEFFRPRGITISNLSITGGFVYKDPSIVAVNVKVFVAEQERNIAIAATSAEQEKNKRVLLEANGKAAALLAQKEAEAKGIRLVADAKAYELEKAKGNKEYFELKKLEVISKQLEKWDGTLPRWVTGGNGMSMLMQLPGEADAKPNPVK